MDFISILIVALVAAFLTDTYYRYMMHYSYYPWRSIGKRSGEEAVPELAQGKEIMDRICFENPIRPQYVEFCKNKHQNLMLQSTVISPIQTHPAIMVAMH